MFFGFEPQQEALLRLLLKNKSGLTSVEIVENLGLGENEVNEHLSVLEDGDYISKSKISGPEDLPEQVFSLTQAGIDLFPKQYPWFSELLLENLKDQLGSEGLENLLDKLGKELAEGMSDRLHILPPIERVSSVVDIIQDLGYDATMENTEDGDLSISACNCVYHKLAVTHNEVCRLDVSLISALLNADISHDTCMVKGDNHCKFKIKKIT